MAKSAGGVRAGKAYVELGVRNTMSQGLRDAEKRLKLFGERVKEIGSSIAMAGAAMAAFGGAIVAAATASVAAFAKIAGDFSDLAAQTGLSVELMSELETALKDAGTSAADFAASVVKLRKNIFEASTGSTSLVEALDALGLKAEDLIDLSADEQFLRVADALSKMRNPTERMALAMQLFGKSAFKMLPILEAGADGIEAFREKARQMGFSLSGETANAADTLGTNLEILKDQFGRLAVSIGEALLPAASAFVGIMQASVGRVIDFIRSNTGLVTGVVAAGAAILALGTAVGILGGVVVFAAAVIAATGTVLGALATVIGALLSPIGLIIAGLATVAGLALWATGVFGDLWDIGVESADRVATAWDGVTDAIAAGDWALAGEIALKALEVAMREGFENIVSRIVAPFMETVTNLIRSLVPVANSVLGGLLGGAGGLGLDAVLREIEAVNELAKRGFVDFGGGRAADELEELRQKAKDARREVEGRTPRSLPLDVDAPDIVAPALVAPALEAPAVDAPSVPEMESIQQEIATRMSAMGGFNAAALGGMFGGPDEMVEQQKKANDFLAKLLEQGKKAREGLVWS